MNANDSPKANAQFVLQQLAEPQSAGSLAPI